MARTTGSHAEQTGPRIRAAALTLFARHGFAAVSMRQIAAEVGVQVGALYNYTPDKQSLLFELMRSHLEGLLEACVVPTNLAPQDQLAWFTRFHIRYHHARPEEVFIAYMELRNLAPDNFARIEALRGRYEKKLEDIIVSGCSTGAFNTRDTKIATLAVIAMLTGITTWFRPGGRLSLEDIQSQYVQMVQRLFVPDPRP